jgi:hypothetical protein
MKPLPMLTVMLFIASCGMKDNEGDYSALVECPPEIAEVALQYAYQYVAANTYYHYGGQDLLKSIKIDCSGLIVNCYMYAVSGTPYALPFQDAAVVDFFNRWTVRTSAPTSGDIIFMGENASQPSHAALFVNTDSGYIHFIDATFKPDEMVNGVSIRKYRSDDAIFLSFGRIKLMVKDGK